jgi:protein SCO1/2
MNILGLRRQTGFAWGVLISLTLLAPAAIAAGHSADPHAHHKQMLQKEAERESNADSVELSIPDVSLLTQYGDTVNLRNDVVGNKIVVIDFVYTTCTTICPVLSAILGQVQGQLTDRLGKDVILVSLTVDPLRDTPKRLKAYSEKHRAADGWFWLTGSKLTVDEVLQQFGVYTPNFEDHPSMVLVGDGASGEWSRFIGFPAAGQIVDKINKFSTARLMQSASTE